MITRATAADNGATTGAVAIADMIIDREAERTKLLKGVDVLFTEYWALRDNAEEREAEIRRLAAELAQANATIARQNRLIADIGALAANGGADAALIAAGHEIPAARAAIPEAG